MCPRELFSLYKNLSGLSFATKRIGPPCCTLFTFVTCFSLQFTLSQNYLLPLISILAENTLLKTAYHFLLLLIGFYTLTYQKDYDRSPILVGHHTPPSSTVHPALHRLLFILPSMGWSCSSCPPRGPVHPAPTSSIDRGPVHPEATPRGPVHPPPPPTVHPYPPQRSLFIQR